MGILELYVLFALSVGIVCTIDWTYPMFYALEECKFTPEQNAFIAHKWLSYFAFFVAYTLAAPVFFVIYLVPGYNHAFWEGMIEGAMRTDEDTDEDTDE